MPEKPAQRATVEAIPSLENSISAVASANAPFIYFDAAPFCGYANGVGSITLTASRQIAELPNKTVGSDNVITGLLRASVPALIGLRGIIDTILLMAEPKPDGEAN